MAEAPLLDLDKLYASIRGMQKPVILARDEAIAKMVADHFKIPFKKSNLVLEGELLLMDSDWRPMFMSNQPASPFSDDARLRDQITWQYRSQYGINTGYGEQTWRLTCPKCGKSFIVQNSTFQEMMKGATRKCSYCPQMLRVSPPSAADAPTPPEPPASASSPPSAPTRGR